MPGNARTPDHRPEDPNVCPAKAYAGEFHVFDTTLRDGSQQEGLNLSVADKLTMPPCSTS